MTVVYTNIFETFGYERVNQLAYDSIYNPTVLSSGTLTLGYRYKFVSVGTTTDFTNVGCIASPVAGTYFYSTGTTPTKWDGATITSGQSPADIIENAIANTRLHFNSIAEYCGVTFTEADEVANAMQYYTMYLLYVRNQKFEEGEDEKKIAYDILIQQWGDGVRRFLEGQTNIIQDPIIREVSASVEREDHAEYDEIDVDEQ